jgi:hypothetical protein
MHFFIVHEVEIRGLLKSKALALVSEADRKDMKYISYGTRFHHTKTTKAQGLVLD